MSLVTTKNAVMTLLGQRSGGAAPSSDANNAQHQQPSLSPEQDPLLRSECNGLLHNNPTKCNRGSEADYEDLESQSSTLGAHDHDSRYGGGYGSYGSLDDNESDPSCSPSTSSTSHSHPSRISARLISDATIGLSDGLTVPFALTAGLSALADTRIVIYGGLAELIAGAISMGLGGYLGARSEAESYAETLGRLRRQVGLDPRAATHAVRSVFASCTDLPRHQLDDLAERVVASPPEVLTSFLMRFHHLEGAEPPSSRAFVSGFTIALGYFVGGLVPLLPYLCVARDDLYTGLAISVGVMAVALFSFGYAKTCMVSGWRGSRNVRKGLAGGAQMVVVGGAAAGAAMLLVRLFNGFAEPDGEGGGGGDGGGGSNP